MVDFIIIGLLVVAMYFNASAALYAWTARASIKAMQAYIDDDSAQGDVWSEEAARRRAIADWFDLFSRKKAS